MTELKDLTLFTFVTDLELSEDEIADGLIEQFGLEAYSLHKTRLGSEKEQSAQLRAGND